ncbi:MAG: 4-carboxymuconolactone decarboxylase [Pseudomonadota bacterium]
MAEDYYTKGNQVRREVLGDHYVERKQEQTHEFDADFQRFLTETSWGGVWARDGLDRRTKSLVTLAIMATMRLDDEFVIHLRATHNTGATHDEIKEVLMHVAAYAGMPTAHHAMRIAKRVLAEFVEGAA